MANTDALTKRIFERIQELKTTARAASLKATGQPDIVRRISKGTIPGADRLARLEAVLLFPPGELISLLEPDARAIALLQEALPAPVPDAAELLGRPGRRDVPVQGLAAGSVAGAVQFTGDTIDWVRRPPALEGVRDIYAIYITGESMFPEHRPGDLRFVHPNRPPLIGDTVVVQVRRQASAEIEGYIKHLTKRTAARLYLGQLNPKTTIEVDLKHVIAIHKVLTQNDLFGV